MTERTAEEWGRVAVELTGWRWVDGMKTTSLPEPLPHDSGEWFRIISTDSKESHKARAAEFEEGLAGCVLDTPHGRIVFTGTAPWDGSPCEWVSLVESDPDPDDEPCEDCEDAGKVCECKTVGWEVVGGSSPAHPIAIKNGTARFPDPDDPATVGCLMSLLDHATVAVHLPPGPGLSCSLTVIDEQRELHKVRAETLGRACIAAAEALGRWPGGAS